MPAAQHMSQDPTVKGLCTEVLVQQPHITEQSACGIHGYPAVQ